MASEITPSLLILHANRLELLRDAVFEWLGRRPLQPLEQEVLPVQSNGVAEWLTALRVNGVTASSEKKRRTRGREWMTSE